MSPGTYRGMSRVVSPAGARLRKRSVKEARAEKRGPSRSQVQSPPNIPGPAAVAEFDLALGADAVLGRLAAVAVLAAAQAWRAESHALSAQLKKAPRLGRGGHGEVPLSIGASTGRSRVCQGEAQQGAGHECRQRRAHGVFWSCCRGRQDIYMWGGGGWE